MSQQNLCRTKVGPCACNVQSSVAGLQQSQRKQQFSKLPSYRAYAVASICIHPEFKKIRYELFVAPSRRDHQRSESIMLARIK
jgi:hypothetical protein